MPEANSQKPAANLFLFGFKITIIYEIGIPFQRKKTNFAPKLNYYDFKLHHLEC